MEGLSVIVRGTTFSAELVRIEPIAKGRLTVEVLLPVRLHRGESCILQNRFGREMHCVFSGVQPWRDVFAAELRCLADETFTSEEEEITGGQEPTP